MAAVVAVVGGATIWLLGGDGDKPGTGQQAGESQSTATVVDGEGQTTASGLPVRPHLRLDHPSGAWADVPASPVLYSEAVDLREVAVPDDSRAWDWDGTGWQFASAGGLVIQEDVTLTLPSTGADGEAVLALTHIGDWVVLSSTATTLPSGDAARQVKVRDIPSPWILVVARPSGAAAVVDAPRAQQLEQLYWTDRTEWERQAAASLADTLKTPGQLGATFARPAPQSGGRLPWELTRDLDAAYQLLGGARLGGVLDQSAVGTPLPALGFTPFALYLEGLDRLDAVRDEWNQKHATWERDYPDNLLYSDDQSIPQALESALAYYAPWGIDLTRYLLHTGTIGAFDLRAVGPYGELLYADASLSSCNENTAIGLDIQALAAQGTTVNCYLRLYSRKALQDTWVDWLKDWKLQTVVRWLPALLVTAGVVSGSGGTALLFAAADQLISSVQDQYAADAAAAYLNLEVASTSGSVGNFVVDTAAGLVQVEGATASLTSTSLGAAQAIYSVALLYGVSQTNWYMLQEVRSLTSGTRSYCPKANCATSLWYGDAVPIPGYDQIPPMQAVAVLQDRPPDYPSDGYPAHRTRVRVWTLPLQRFGADLHRLLIGGASCEEATIGIHREVLCPATGAWRGGLADLPLEAYKEDQWPSVTELSAPAAQALRVSIPKAVLEALAIDNGLGPSPAPSDYALVLRAEAPDGSRALFQIDQFLVPAPNEDPNNVYFQVVIPGTWKGEPPDLSGIDAAYDGLRGDMSGSVLQTKLTLDLRSSGDEEPRAIGNVDFTASTTADVEIYPGIEAAEHLHSQRVDLTPVSTATDWRITSLSLTESGAFNDPGFYRNNLPMLRKVGAQPDACKLDSSQYSETDGLDLDLVCVFEAGCPNDDSCLVWPLAGSHFQLGGALTITRTRIDGEVCTAAEGEDLACILRSSIHADRSSSGTLTGVFEVWSQYQRDGTEGTMTFSFTAEPTR